MYEQIEINNKERKILNYIGLNQDRNRKLTRNKLARELKEHIYSTYAVSNGLQEKGYITYEKINKVESILRLTSEGASMVLQLNSNSVI